MVLKELCTLRGVSGNEHEVRDFLLEKVRKKADEVRVDRMGNVLAVKKADRADAPTILLDAHMDEVGMIVVGVNDNGLLSYDTVGGIDSRVVVSKRVRVGEKAVPGVIGAKAIHLQTAAERETVLGHSDLYIDIGAKDKAQAEELVQPGDYVSFDSDYMEGAHPSILEALSKINFEQNPGYGTDAYCASAKEKIRKARLRTRFRRPAHKIILKGLPAHEKHVRAYLWAEYSN